MLDDSMLKERLEVDIDELCEAYEFSSSEKSYYLDLETGEVLLIVHRSGVAEQNRKNKEKIEQDDEDRYIEVPSSDSREGIEICRTSYRQLRTKI
ncbi:MAG: UPF0158 family protein [Candidatus Thermoplasmatota archaeon]